MMTNSMSKPIDLNSYRTANSAGAEPMAPGATARILLFTGVRYERMVDTDTPARVGHA